MREIKFRCWNKHNRKECAMLSWEKLLSDMYTFKFATQDKEESHILMQFTGLKDKNEKEIYEGDILKITRVNWYCLGHPKNNTDVIDQVEIYWDEEKNGMFSRTFDFERLKRNPNQRPYCSSGSLGSGWNDERADENIWEVIGNIYENPELTKHDALHESKDDNNVKEKKNG